MATVSVKIFKPKSPDNVLSKRYKVVAWRNGSQYSVSFVDTKKQAQILQRNIRNMLRRS